MSASVILRKRRGQSPGGYPCLWLRKSVRHKVSQLCIGFNDTALEMMGGLPLKVDIECSHTTLRVKPDPEGYTVTPVSDKWRECASANLLRLFSESGIELPYQTWLKAEMEDGSLYVYLDKEKG